ncbi:hypothetical protein Cni_G25799 [Canna indica]|uniref:Reverse transcriptase domain-containing protein n=1 Tax=Canna indica TaxID=4628 RepID=A0AAQ3QPS3_9LILI|nr:hypothetical protein Cni_G25799 [Canna indica]
MASNLNWKKLSNHEAKELCREFTAKEVWNAVNSLGRGKAPGPDGYNVEFYIKYWSIVGANIISAIREFQITAKLLVHWGNTTLVFVPKTEGPAKITDFRPIALCNVLYEILSKALVNRIRPCIKRLISSEQCAFIEGRRIQDNILLANEIINSVSKSKRK